MVVRKLAFDLQALVLHTLCIPTYIINGCQNNSSSDPMWGKSKPYIIKYVKIPHLRRIECQDTLK